MPAGDAADLRVAAFGNHLKMLIMKKSYLLAGVIVLAANSGFAQVKVGASGSPDASAMLEVTSGTANNKGLLMPRMTTAQRNAIASPATGLMIYNTTTNEAQVNTGTPAAPTWTVATATATGWATNGNTGTTPVTNFIGTTDNQPLTVRTNNTEKMRVTETGSVGIGTNAPLAKLHVVDTGNVSIVVASSSSNAASINLGNGHHGITRNLSNAGGGANDVALYTTSGSPSTPASIHLGVRANVTDTLDLNQFVLKNTGYVGIGTDTPAVKLHVNNGGFRVSNGTTALTAPAIYVVNDGGGPGNNDNIVINSYGTNTQPSIGTQSSRGTFDTPQNSQAGDNIGNFFFNARVNGSTVNCNVIRGVYLGNGTVNRSRLNFFTSNTLAMSIDSNQNVGIGTASPKVKLHLGGGLLLARDTNPAHANGSFFVWSTVRSNIGETEFINYHGTGSGGFRFYDVDPGTTTGTAAYNTNNIAFIAPGTGAYTNVSDKRVKTNINTINDGLKKVMAMRPVSYDFHTGRKLQDGVVTFTPNDKPIKTIGFVAQELAEIVPEAVIIPKDPANELYTVSYATVVPILTKAIQEQQAEIEALKARNSQLEAAHKVTAQLLERVKQMEQMIGIKEIEGTSKVAGK